MSLPKVIKPRRIFTDNPKIWYKDMWDKVFVVRRENPKDYIVSWNGRAMDIPKQKCELLEVEEAKLK